MGCKQKTAYVSSISWNVLRKFRTLRDAPMWPGGTTSKLAFWILVEIFHMRALHKPRQKPTAAPSLPLKRSPSPALDVAS